MERIHHLKQIEEHLTEATGIVHAGTADPTMGTESIDIEKEIAAVEAERESRRIEREKIANFQDEVVTKMDTLIAYLESYIEYLYSGERIKDQEQNWRLEPIVKLCEELAARKMEHRELFHSMVIPVLKLMRENVLYPESRKDQLKFAARALNTYLLENNYQHGERLFEIEGAKAEDIQYHPEGFLVREGDEIYLNGFKLVYEGKMDEWYAHPKGVVVRKGKKYELKGFEKEDDAEFEFKKRLNMAWTGDQGFFVRDKDGNIFLDGKPVAFDKNVEQAFRLSAPVSSLPDEGFIDGEDFGLHTKKSYYTISMPRGLDVFMMYSGEYSGRQHEGVKVVSCKYGEKNGFKGLILDAEYLINVAHRYLEKGFFSCPFDPDKKAYLYRVQVNNDIWWRKVEIKNYQLDEIVETFPKDEIPEFLPHPKYGAVLVFSDCVFINEKKVFTGRNQGVALTADGVLIKDELGEWRVYHYEAEELAVIRRKIHDKNDMFKGGKVEVEQTVKVEIRRVATIDLPSDRQREEGRMIRLKHEKWGYIYCYPNALYVGEKCIFRGRYFYRNVTIKKTGGLLVKTKEGGAILFY